MSKIHETMAISEKYSPRKSDMISTLSYQPGKMMVVYHFPKDRQGVASGSWLVGKITKETADFFEVCGHVIKKSTATIGLASKNRNIAAWIRDQRSQVERNAASNLAHANQIQSLTKRAEAAEKGLRRIAAGEPTGDARREATI